MLPADVWEMRHVFCSERSKVADGRLALSFQMCLESFTLLLPENTRRPRTRKGKEAGRRLKTWFRLGHWSTLVLCVCWCGGLSHKGVRSGDSLICLDRKDQQKKPCDSKRSGLFLGKHRDGSTRGHQRQPHFCAKVQLIRKHPCQGAGNKINTQISIVSLCEQWTVQKEVMRTCYSIYNSIKENSTWESIYQTKTTKHRWKRDKTNGRRS